MKKIKNYFIFTTILIVLSHMGFSQLTQSKLLNIPVQPGSKYINQRNLSNISTTSFPINTTHQAYIDFVTDGGFNGNSWESNIMATYCGQAPRYASQVITDNDGRLQAFIIDNYIYGTTGDIIADLTDNYYHGSILTQPTYDSFDEYNLYHNIIVMPNGDQCDGFYIFSAIGTTNGTECPVLSISMFDPKEPEAYQVKSIIIDSVRDLDRCINFSMGAVRNEGTGDDLLILQTGSELKIYNVSDFNFDNDYFPHTVLSLDANIVGQEGFEINRPDMTITSFDAENYLVATSVIKYNYITSPPVSDNHLLFLKVPKNYSLITQNTVEQKYASTDGTKGCTGMEFSADSKYLYFTDRDNDPYFNSIRYCNLTNAINSGDFADITGGYQLLSSVTGDYRKSELELGRDGKLYAINNANGSITQIIGTNNPLTATANYNTYGITCQAMTYNGYLNWPSRAYYFSHQLDGSFYHDGWPYSNSTNPNFGSLTSPATWSPGVGNNPFNSESGVIYLSSSMVIPSGFNLTIQNMEFHFASSTNVIINTGAVLALSNTTLTANTSCTPTNMWGGVIVRGNGTLTQTTTNQGRIRVLNSGAKITNAVLGIHAQSGAMVYILNGVFQNNRSSLKLDSYSYPGVPNYNAAYIYGADFIINRELNDGVDPTEQIYLDNVKTINISNCDFINSRDLSVAAEHRGMAIRTANSTKFAVTGNINMTNVIQGFNYAINSNQPTSPSITRTNFNNNYRGLYLISPTTPIVESNNFNTYDFANNSSYNQSDPNTYPYGCYIFGNGTNTTFTLESNVVTAEFPALGLYVNNSGYNANVVRDNVFKGESSTSLIGYGCINLAKNSDYGSGTGSRGLQYRCNIFDDYFSALSVVDGNIRKIQGDVVLGNITTYAGNGFDRSTFFDQGDFYVDLNIVPSTLDLGNYTYCSNAEGLVNGYYHNLLNILPIPVGKVNNLIGGVYNDTHCVESTKDGGTIQTLISASEGSELVSQIDNEKALMEYDLALLIDNGNTTQLLTDVENVNPISDDEVSEKVANVEGYISDEVALTYLENDNANQYAKAEALLANSPLPSNIVAEIENAPMDDNLKSLLILNQNGINAREAKEMQIAELHQNRSLIVNAMVRGYWDENASEENRAQLKNFLVSDNEIVSQQHLFDIYLYEKNYTAANECLAKIEDLAYICDMDYIIEHENNNNVLRLMMEIEQGNISLDEVVAQNIDLLKAMKSENEVAGSVYAAILLDKAKIEPMTEVIRLPEPAVEQKNAAVDKKSNFNVSFSDLVNIYPNPASDFVYVEYILTDVSNYKSVNLYNASGSLIKSYPVIQKAGYVKIDVNGLSAGTYVVCIGENGGKFSKQIVIQ